MTLRGYLAQGNMSHKYMFINKSHKYIKPPRTHLVYSSILVVYSKHVIPTPEFLQATTKREFYNGANC